MRSQEAWNMHLRVQQTIRGGRHACATNTKVQWSKTFMDDDWLARHAHIYTYARKYSGTMCVYWRCYSREKAEHRHTRSRARALSLSLTHTHTFGLERTGDTGGCAPRFFRGKRVFHVYCLSPSPPGRFRYFSFKHIIDCAIISTHEHINQHVWTYGMQLSVIAQRERERERERGEGGFRERTSCTDMKI